MTLAYETSDRVDRKGETRPLLDRVPKLPDYTPTKHILLLSIPSVPFLYLMGVGVGGEVEFDVRDSLILELKIFISKVQNQRQRFLDTEYSTWKPRLVGYRITCYQRSQRSTPFSEYASCYHSVA